MIYGDFGSGKSMALRDIYFKLRDEFTAGRQMKWTPFVGPWGSKFRV